MEIAKPKRVFLHWYNHHILDVTKGYEGWFHISEGANGEGLGPYVPETKPSDDMTVPMENPYKEYLLWTESDGWFVGCYDKKKGVFYWTTHDLCGDETISPTYWLPMPPAPL